LKFARRAAASALVLALVATLAWAAAPAKPAARPATPPATGSPARAPQPPAPRPATRPAPTDDAVDAIAAMVNDEAVLVSDVEEALYGFLQQSGARPDSAQIDTLRRQVLDQIIDDRLLEGEAKRQGITATDAEVNRQVDMAIEQARERIGGDEAFQEQLKREGLTEPQLRERYRADARKAIPVDKLKQKQFPPRKAPQAEAEAYFNLHKDRFPRVPPEVHLQVIQVPPLPDSAAVAAGLVRINAIRKRVVGGEKFAKVAAEASEDPASAKAGGDLGFFSRGRLAKEFEDAAFALADGELSGPVRSPYGWHVIQTIERDTVKAANGRDSLADGKPVLELHARHILVRLTPTEADVERARQLAEHVRDEAAKGTNFGTLVRRYSKYDGPATADGDVGFISLGNLQPQIRAGLDSLEIGQVSAVMSNQSGFNVFKVVDRHPERDYTLEEVREELPNAVGELQRREKLEAWMKTLRAKAQIEYR
jgi:peptidyl-prolyl cis-trans isomerase SurA